MRSFCSAEPTLGGRGGTFCTHDHNWRAAQNRSPRYPQSSLAAARAAVITAACRAGVRSVHRAFQVPAVPDCDAWTIPRYGSNSDPPVLGCASIQTFAAWQAWKYSSSVESAGTSTLVVTPPGERPTAPGGAEVAPRGMSDGRADDELTLPPGDPFEHPVTATKNAAARTTPRCPWG
jgi:hypothetical protein